MASPAPGRRSRDGGVRLISSEADTLAARSAPAMETRTKSEPPEPAPGAGTTASSAIATGELDTIEPGPDRSGQRLGHFLLQRKLGQGGMGVVYAAEDEKLRRRVALKLMPAEVARSPERRRRFLREARSASAFVHPNVAAVFEIDEDGDDLFLVMEYVEGRTLRALLRERGGPLATTEALPLARAIARGAARAHKAGVVHRDLKPENVMIAADGGVKVLDFGVARLLRAGGDIDHTPTASELATVEGRILGTPGYMAPEQASGRAVDARADVFSFGVVLFEMLAGARPFGGENAMERIIAVDRDAPRPLPEGVPPALAQIVARCLEKRAEDRFASCVEVVDALDAFDALGAMSTVRVGGLPEPARPAPRRFRAKLAGGTVAVAIAGAALAAARARSTPVPAPPAISAVTPAAPVPRRLCLDADAGPVECSGAENLAWCDGGSRRIACCGRGLVPVGTDGICGCPPGGTQVMAALARGCKSPPPEREAAAKHAKTQATTQAINCFESLLDAGRIDGGEFAANYVLSPEGEVIEARVYMSSLPNEDAQACALAALRATRFPPPLGEEAGKVLGFGFVFATRAEQEQRKR